VEPAVHAGLHQHARARRALAHHQGGGEEPQAHRAGPSGLHGVLISSARVSLFGIALGLSLLGGLGGLIVASGVLLINDSARTRLVPWLVSYAVGTLLGV